MIRLVRAFERKGTAWRVPTHHPAKESVFRCRSAVIDTSVTSPPVHGWLVPVLLLPGVIGIWFDFGLVYLIAAGIIGSTMRVSFPHLDPLRRQLRAVGLTYLAIAFSPLIAFAFFVHFDLWRIRNAAVGAPLVFVPMLKQGIVGFTNVLLLVWALAIAWKRARV